MRHLVAVLMVASALAGTPSRGDWARWALATSVEKAALPVDEVTIVVGPARGRMRWWDMHCRCATGDFTIRVLSERVPMCSTSGIGEVRTYILKEGDEAPLSFVNLETGSALLPEFSFRDQLLPNPVPDTLWEGPFATTGTMLGHAVVLVEAGRGKKFEELGPVVELELDPGLLIGTGRNVRDVEEHRVPEPDDYTYRKLDASDYEACIEAGFNYFVSLDDEQIEYVRRRPVFYERWPSPYPRILYRPNYHGMRMFIDEPAIRLEWEALEGCNRAVDSATVLTLRDREKYLSHALSLDRTLRGVGVNLGALCLVETDIPVWETIYQTAWYQLAGGPTGLVHEGRYDLQGYLSELEELFGGPVDVTAEQMLRLHYAYLRGAARNFRGDWGMSIYGQADPGISPLALTLAYDMGARYLWFWTSDHGHHMPFPEQLQLARVIRDHKREHPRPPRSELVDAARVAVAFPPGYTGFLHDWFWLPPFFNQQGTNHAGVTHATVIKAAMAEAVMLVKSGVDFDFVVNDSRFRPEGYDRVLLVGYDGSVSEWRPEP